jgi:hypothetical protein
VALKTHECCCLKVLSTIDATHGTADADADGIDICMLQYGRSLKPGQRYVQAQHVHDARVDREVQEAADTAAAEEAARVARNQAAWQANAE